MMILQVNQLSKSFGADTVLTNIKLEVKARDRIAIVGRNGAGKSTLLKIIAGQMSYEQGEIIKPKDLSIGYLAQHTDVTSTRTLKRRTTIRFRSFKRNGTRDENHRRENGFFHRNRIRFSNENL